MPHVPARLEALKTRQEKGEAALPGSRSLGSPMLGLVWFGASVSLAEILTGTFFAPLGFERGMAAVLVGHAIGCVLFWLVAYLSAKTGRSAMEAVRLSFGRHGAKAFSVANVAQLVGWTAIMVASGAAAAAYLVPVLGALGWCLVIGALIVLWIAVGMRKMGYLQSISAALLAALCAVVSATVFGDGAASATAGAGAAAAGAEGGDALSFGAAVELAVAMPLSWLPVAGDYTRAAKHPVAGTTASTVAYFVGSSWMYAVGLGLALFAGSDDIAAVLAAAGLGVVGVVVVVLSTVTTTFLDARSAGESAHAIHPKLGVRTIGIAAAVAGTVLAICAPVGDFEEFLYLIGSVFAPMAAVLIADALIGRRDASASAVDWANLVVWAVGFVMYRCSMAWDLPCGNTLPVMAITAALALGVHALRKKR